MNRFLSKDEMMCLSLVLRKFFEEFFNEEGVSFEESMDDFLILPLSNQGNYYYVVHKSEVESIDDFQDKVVSMHVVFYFLNNFDGFNAYSIDKQWRVSGLIDKSTPKENYLKELNKQNSVLNFFNAIKMRVSIE